MYEKKMNRKNRNPRKRLDSTCVFGFENTSIYSYIITINHKKQRIDMKLDYHEQTSIILSVEESSRSRRIIPVSHKATQTGWFALLSLCVVGLLMGGCSTLPNVYGNKLNRSVKERAFEEIRYIASPKEKNKLDSLNAPEEINKFMDEFWKKRDPNLATPENELRVEVDKRIAYADSLLGGSHLDKGRVYIIYGKPHEIKYYDWQGQGGLLSRMPGQNTDYYGQPESGENQPITLRANNVEIWIYNIPTKNHPSPSIFDNYDNIDRAFVKFVFADVNSFGLMMQIYSTEANEKCDARVFVSGTPIH
jgi:GWxTD domain-containing protein